VKSLALEGPLVAGSGTGSVGRAGALDAAPLALDLHLQARDPGLRQLLAAQGLAPGPDGTATLLISGTLGNPILRPGVGGAPAGGAGVPRPVGSSSAGAPPLGAARTPRAAH
jgi:hypothetical protein